MEKRVKELERQVEVLTRFVEALTPLEMGDLAVNRLLAELK